MMIFAPAETEPADFHESLTRIVANRSGDHVLTLPLLLPAAGPAVSTYENDQRLTVAATLHKDFPLVSNPETGTRISATGEKLTLTVKSGDTLDGLFGRHNLRRADLMALLDLSAARSMLRDIKPGDRFEVTHNNGDLQSLERRVDETTTVRVVRDEQGFALQKIDHPIENRLAYRHGTIDSSLFEAGKQANVADKVIMNLAGIFAWDIDFVLDIRRGDRFVVIYEEIWQEGEFLRDGEIQAAEFINNGDSYRALRYVDSSGKADYYTPDGHSVRKAFIRAPVDFSRVSSRFNPRRRHPILNVVRAHKGVDYAAPSGTRVKAAGDGKVIHRGKKGGYGNTIILQHGGNITTLYGHLSRFARQARIGRRVKQGQVIGYVGKTGLATAPHLHYEYRLNGVHRNPRTVSLPKAAPIAEDQHDAFFQQTGGLLAQLDTVRRSQVAIAAVP
ncbi:MAG: peptidoglycan DD-metalloendopeptidase family protein [Proteobacteria bacterium]|nr:peptidoglycan DD-metalloendopeptidase family protein [Pseudomonadota bacterium]